MAKAPGKRIDTWEIAQQGKSYRVAVYLTNTKGSFGFTAICAECELDLRASDINQLKTACEDYIRGLVLYTWESRTVLTLTCGLPHEAAELPAVDNPENWLDICNERLGLTASQVWLGTDASGACVYSCTRTRYVTEGEPSLGAQHDGYRILLPLDEDVRDATIALHNSLARLGLAVEAKFALCQDENDLQNLAADITAVTAKFETKHKLVRK